MSRADLTRRAFAASAVGVSAAALAGCGDDTDSTTSGADGSPSPSGGGGAGLVAVADVPVGGGVVVEDQRVVVTQPTKGDVKAFSAVCTHQGCVVTSVADNVIACGCHGSTFSAEDGSVLQGPATAALAALDVTVAKGQVVEA